MKIKSPLVTAASAGTMLLGLAYAHGADWSKADPNEQSQTVETQIAMSGSAGMPSQFDAYGNLGGSDPYSPLSGVSLPEIDKSYSTNRPATDLEKLVPGKMMSVGDGAVSRQNGDPLPRAVLDGIPETGRASGSDSDEDSLAKDRGVMLYQGGGDPLGLTPFVMTNRSMGQAGGPPGMGGRSKPDIYDPAVQTSVETLNYVVNSLIAMATEFTIWIKSSF